MNSHDKNEVLFKKLEWLNSREAAEYLRISIANLRVKVSRGQLPVPAKIGRTWRFRRDELDRFLESSVDY